MTNAWRAADELAAQGVRAAVINLPWLNRIDDDVGRARRSAAFRRSSRSTTTTSTLGQGVMVGAALARTGVARRVSARSA